MAEFDLQRAFEGVHTRLNDISAVQSESTAHLAQVDTHLAGLLGNGQPGRIAKLEIAVTDLVEHKNKALGYVAALGGFLTILGVVGHYIVDMLRTIPGAPK